jgi:hypothetical protein
MDSSTPFTKALPLAVDVPIESIGKADNYIDDLIVVIPGDANNISRGNAAAALALELVPPPSSRGDKLRNMVGRLNHVGYIIPAARHFLGRIRHFEGPAYPTTDAICRIDSPVLEEIPTRQRIDPWRHE